MTKPTTLTVVLAVMTLVVAAVATYGLVDHSRTQDQIARTNSSLRRGTQQLQALRQQLQDLTAAHRDLKQSVSAVQGALSSRPDDAATVKTATRSVSPSSPAPAAGPAGSWIALPDDPAS